MQWQFWQSSVGEFCVQAEMELSSLKTDVMMTAKRCSDSTF